MQWGAAFSCIELYNLKLYELMTAKEKIEQESKNVNAIYLHKEGMFWRAYNQSAMLFVDNLKSLKIIRRYIKNVKQDIFYCGFPESSWDTIQKQAVEKGFLVTAADTNTIIISGVSAENDYKSWMQKFPPEKETGEIKTSSSQYLAVLPSKIEGLLPGIIIRQIQQYSLENATPIETMLFIQKLKQAINSEHSSQS